MCALEARARAASALALRGRLGARLEYLEAENVQEEVSHAGIGGAAHAERSGRALFTHEPAPLKP